MQEPIIDLIDVTPDMAREWLGFNTHNRNVRGRTVAAYAADMKNGDWQLNGEAIKFASDGSLIDGQHRLHAIVEAGVTIRMLVIRGLPADVQETVDGGVSRKFGDVLKLRGEPSYAALAAVARRIAVWEATGTFSTGAAHPTKAQLSRVIERYPQLREESTLAYRVARSCGLAPSIVGFCIWLFGQLPDADEDIEFFFGRLADFQGLTKGDPIYELRRAVEQSKGVRGERGTKYLVAITIKAWNAFRAGEKVGVLRFTTGGAHPEKFPQPI